MADRIYSNKGNPPLVDLLDDGCTRILDIGCGAGDNASLIRLRHPRCEVSGITHSQAEATIAGEHLERCWVFDIEGDLPPDLCAKTFDVLIFSHVLEHVRDPDEILARFVMLLQRGGQVLIAVPNVLSWKMRMQFLRGRFEYESAGVLDDTHLRFFTFFTAAPYLLAKTRNLEIRTVSATGSVPLWLLRRHLFPRSWCDRIDRWGCRYWPNLFGGQVLIAARKV